MEDSNKQHLQLNNPTQAQINNMIPSIGRIVHYTLSHTDIEIIRKRRNWALGEKSDHLGNPVVVGDIFPAMITRVWDSNPTEESVVQLQVFLDGSDQVWASSVHQGTNEGQWAEPAKI